MRSTSQNPATRPFLPFGLIVLALILSAVLGARAFKLPKNLPVAGLQKFFAFSGDRWALESAHNQMFLRRR
jgi:hypothetical protein